MKRYLAIAATAVLGGALLAGCETATHPHSYDMAKQDFQSRNYPAAYAEVKGPARAGDPNAQYALGYMYFYGKGVEQSNEKAAYWFEKAAAQGHRGAMKALAKMQREGIVGGERRVMREYGMNEEHHMNRHRHHAVYSTDGDRRMSMDEEHHMKAKHKAKKHKAKKAAKAKKNADDTKKDSNDSDKSTATASTDNGTATATTDQGTATASTDQTTDQGTATAGATS